MKECAIAKSSGKEMPICQFIKTMPLAKYVNQGFSPDSLRGEIRETCRELVDLKFRILPALEDVACGKKYQKKPENTSSGKESG